VNGPTSHTPPTAVREPIGTDGVRVAAISLTPVKGLRLGSYQSVELGRDGVWEDRRFFVLDPNGRPVAVVNNPAMFSITANYDRGSGELRLATDTDEVHGEVRTGGPLVAKLARRSVSCRSVIGPWADFLTTHLQREVFLAQVVSSDRGTAVHPVSVVGRGSLERLSMQVGTEVDARRFRMLFEVTTSEPHCEDGWLGADVAFGDAVVRIVEATKRCQIISADPTSGDRNLDLLRPIHQYRSESESSGAAFGVYGVVLSPGTVRLGDRVEVRTEVSDVMSAYRSGTGDAG
jgi:uncharacterized protein YcbX